MRCDDCEKTGVYSNRFDVTLCNECLVKRTFESAAPDPCGLPLCECGKPKVPWRDHEWTRGEHRGNGLKCFWCYPYTENDYLCYSCREPGPDGKSHPYCEPCQKKHATKGREAAIREDAGRRRENAPDESFLPRADSSSGVTAPPRPTPPPDEGALWREEVRLLRAEEPEEKRWAVGTQVVDGTYRSGSTTKSTPSRADGMALASVDHHAPPKRNPRRVCVMGREDWKDDNPDHGPGLCATCGCRKWVWDK